MHKDVTFIRSRSNVTTITSDYFFESLAYQGTPVDSGRFMHHAVPPSTPHHPPEGHLTGASRRVDWLSEVYSLVKGSPEAIAKLLVQLLGRCCWPKWLGGWILYGCPYKW